MMRYVKVLFLVMLAFGLMASGVWAGNITYNAGTANLVALDAMGAGRNLSVPGSVTGTGANVGFNNATFRITPGQQLASGSLLTVSFVNSAFNGTAVNLCAANNDTIAVTAPVGTATPAANTSSQGFVLGTTVASGQTLFVTTDGGNCNNSNGAFIIRFQPVTSAAFAQVSYNVALQGTVYDSKGAVNVGNIAEQYPRFYGVGNSTIDFALNATSNGAHFLNSSNAAVSGTANINYVTMDIGTTGTSPNAGLTVTALLALQDTSSWQGVKDVWVDGAGDCSAGSLPNNNAINSTPSGTVNLGLPTTAFGGTAQYLANVCVDVKGNIPLQTRTIKAGYNISVSSGGVSPGQDAFTTVQNWISNGYQAAIPYINGSSTFATICFLNNMSSASGTVTTSIVSAESGASLAGLTGLAVGSLAAGQTMRMDFTQSPAGTGAVSIIPYSYSGGVESAGTAIPLTGIQTNDRYSAIISIGASPTQITVNCIQLDPAGSKRAVPVLTQSGATVPWNY